MYVNAVLSCFVGLTRMHAARVGKELIVRMLNGDSRLAMEIARAEVRSDLFGRITQACGTGSYCRAGQ